MNNQLYIGNLPAGVGEERLRALFSQKGIVIAISMVLDPATHESRGSALVTMATSEQAAVAVQAFHCYSLAGRNIAVSEARSSPLPATGLIGQGFEHGHGPFSFLPRDRRTIKERRRRSGKFQG